jgi:hypothetical protein
MRVEVGGEGRVPRLREARREPADIVVQAEGLVQHDDARVGALANRRKVLGAQACFVRQGDLKPLSATSPHNQCLTA